MALYICVLHTIVSVRFVSARDGFVLTVRLQSSHPHGRDEIEEALAWSDSENGKVQSPPQPVATAAGVKRRPCYTRACTAVKSRTPVPGFDGRLFPRGGADRDPLTKLTSL
eukprot:scaffold2642_cov101-Isochrysis_galbana.AAC.2